MPYMSRTQTATLKMVGTLLFRVRVQNSMTTTGDFSWSFQTPGIRLIVHNGPIVRTSGPISMHRAQVMPQELIKVLDATEKLSFKIALSEIIIIKKMQLKTGLVRTDPTQSSSLIRLVIMIIKLEHVILPLKW